MKQPGSGEGRVDLADERLSDLLKAAQNEPSSIAEVFEHQRSDMRRWGGGRFWQFFVEGVGIDLNEIALANVAWCATADKDTRATMLTSCRRRFTEKLVEQLAPHKMIVSGSAVKSHGKAISRLQQSLEIHETLAYAHRKGKVAEDHAVNACRAFLAAQ